MLPRIAKIFQGLTLRRNAHIRYLLAAMALLLVAALPASADSLDNWSSQTSGTSYDLCKVTYGSDTFVAVTQNKILASKDGGATWNQVLNESVWLDGVTSGWGTFVAVGSEGCGGKGLILTSPDGTGWTLRTSGTSNPLYNVTYGNVNGTNTFVAVGGHGTILTSQDGGASWTSQTSGTQNDLTGVTYGNINGTDTFVAVGSNGTILTSDDSATWKPRTSFTSNYLTGVTCGNGSFVAVGAYGTIRTSKDGGATWYTQVSGILNTIDDITYCGGNFVAVGGTGTILTSNDGATWTPRTSGTSSNLYGVTYGGGTFVAVGIQGTILQSNNMATLSVQPTEAHPGDTISISLNWNVFPNNVHTYSLVLVESKENANHIVKVITNPPQSWSSFYQQYPLPHDLNTGTYYVWLVKDYNPNQVNPNQVLAISKCLNVTALASTTPSTPTGTLGTISTLNPTVHLPNPIPIIPRLPTLNGSTGTSSTLQLTARGGDQSVTLNWTAPSYGKTVTGYYPYRGTSSGGELPEPLRDFPVTGTSYTDQNVKNGVTYYYILKPVFKDFSEGAVSNEASATPGAPATGTFTNTTGTTTNSAATTIVLTVGSPTATVNGTRQIDLGAAPEIHDSRVFLPIAPIVVALGGNASWDPAQEQVTLTLGANTIDLWIGQSNAQVNGATVPIDPNNPDIVPYISNGHTMLPLRFVTENLGCHVTWDGSNQSVTIIYNNPSGASTTSSGSTSNGITRRNQT